MPLRPRVVALDLEGTLISNAMSCFARPGLHAFLEGCHRMFAQVVLFTAVSEARVRPILDVLVREGEAPAWLRDIEYVEWTGGVKDLRFNDRNAAGEALLVDDLESYVHPEQRCQWVPIARLCLPTRRRTGSLFGCWTISRRGRRGVDRTPSGRHSLAWLQWH